MAEKELKPDYSSSSADEDVSGSEEEEESSGSEVSDSDSDQKQPKKTVIEPSQVAITPDLSSESEESGSDSDSDSPPNKPVISDPNSKLISSKPMQPEKVTKTKPKATPSAKRPATPLNDKDSKKPKTNTNTVDDDTKKQLFQRLWSEDDEIVILKGMIDYKIAKNGESPSGDMGAFHEFIKKSLHIDVSRAQLVDKIRRLKKKFVNNVGREKNGKDRMFSKSHEQKGYELSKLIWGIDSSASGSDSKKNGKVISKSNAASASTSAGLKLNELDYKEASMVDAEKSMDISRFVQYSRNHGGPVLTEELMKSGFELLQGSARVEMEEKWKELKKQELKLFVKRMDLLKEQAVRVLEAVNSLR